MSQKLQNALANARRIIRCTPQILQSGVKHECARCDVQSCRQRLCPGTVSAR